MPQTESVFTYTEAVDYARFLCEDETNPSISLARMNQMVFEAAQLYFSEVEVGVRFLTAGQSNATFASANSFRKDLTTIAASWNILDIVGAYAMSNTSEDQSTRPDRVLERVEMHRMTALHLADQSDSATPTYYAVERIDPDRPNSFALWIHPRSDGSANVMLACKVAPLEIQTGGEQLPTDPVGSNAIARMAAIQAATILGRDPEKIQGLIAGLPQKVQELYRNLKVNLRPVVRREEELV